MMTSRILCPTLLASLLPTVASGQTATQREVVARTDSLLAAYRDPDLVAVARFFADDATISGPGGLRVRGREALDRYWTGRSRTPRWTIETFEVGGSRDQPWQTARSIRITPTATGADTTRTDFVLIWKRAPDGRLRIFYDIFN